jgi:general secretion pathway protein D
MNKFFFSILLLAIVSFACAKKSAVETWQDKHYKGDFVDAMQMPDKPSVLEKRKADALAEEKERKAKERSKDKEADDDLALPTEQLPDARIAKMVVLTADDVILRRGPGASFKSVGTANKNDMFVLLQTTRGVDRDDLWYKVHDQKGNKFFISGRQAHIKQVKEQIKRSERVSLEKIQTLFDPTPPLPPELVQAKTITLNFENTDVYDVITTFCELLKLDYVIEGDIKGRITLQTFNNIAVGDLYSVLEQILAVNHLTVVRSGKLYRFLPIPDAIKKPVSIHYGENANIPDSDRLIIQIMPLKHISVESMKKIIQPLLTKDATFLDVPETNNLMLVELASNVKRIVRVVQALDIDKLSQSDVHLYRIEHSEAATVVKELNEVFSSIGYKDVLGDSLNFLAVERLNSILVVNTFEDISPIIEFWVEKLDQPVLLGVNRMSTFVYYVQNGEASILAGLVKAVFQSTLQPQALQQKKKPGVPGAPGAPGAAAPGGAQTGGQQSAFGALTTPPAPAAPAPSAAPPTAPTASAPTSSIPSIVNPVTDLASLGGPRVSVSSGLAGKKDALGGAADQDFEGNLIVLPDKDTNSLIIRTNPRNYPAILELLKKLDLMPQQVLIEVLIVDVVLDNNVQMSIDGLFRDPKASATSSGSLFRGEAFGVGNTPSGLTLGSALGTAAGTFSVFVGKPDKFIALLQALASDSKANILANPVLVTSSNKLANIAITQEVPIVTTVVIPGSGGNPATLAPQVQYRSVGTILSIDPKINKENFVSLKVIQEISELGAQIQGATQPSFNTRKLTTEVVLKDNQSLVMGGLMRTRTASASTGIPFLKDIPYLGLLFGSQTTSLQKTELMLFITPHIITTAQDSQFVTDQIKTRLERLKLAPKEELEPETLPTVKVEEIPELSIDTKNKGDSLDPAKDTEAEMEKKAEELRRRKERIEVVPFRTKVAETSKDKAEPSASSKKAEPVAPEKKPEEPALRIEKIVPMPRSTSVAP